MNEIKKLNPEEIWRNFDALTQIPRPSGHLEKVQQFLLDFAKKAGVEAYKDAGNNIYMHKPATPGKENCKGVILQAHMDMVPQKSPASTHNFETDPIETYIDGEWVKAKETTLGSDDGIGVATIMAVMESKELQHGPVEALITADEETGMYGANDLPKGELQGDILLNLDSETWGNFVIGSAGGIDVTAEMTYKDIPVREGDRALKITLKGLKGGHSGLEINEGRANANKLMARVVRTAVSEHNACLYSWEGGNMRNAIPFKAEVILTLPASETEAVKKNIAEWKTIFEHEYQGIEESIEFSTEEVDTPATVTPEEIQDNLIDAIYACHDGVVRMIPAIPEVVETSSNLAIIDICEGKASFKILARSSSETMKDYVAKTLISCFSMAGMKVTLSGDYGGWDPNTNSEILHILEKTFKKQNGTDPIVKVDHAGLECSVILEKYPNLDIVSFGPTLRSPHTTNERCLISSIAPYWKLIKEILANIPEKRL